MLCIDFIFAFRQDGRNLLKWFGREEAWKKYSLLKTHHANFLKEQQTSGMPYKDNDTPPAICFKVFPIDNPPATRLLCQSCQLIEFSFC